MRLGSQQSAPEKAQSRQGKTLLLPCQDTQAVHSHLGKVVVDKTEQPFLQPWLVRQLRGGPRGTVCRGQACGRSSTQSQAPRRQWQSGKRRDEGSRAGGAAEGREREEDRVAAQSKARPSCSHISREGKRCDYPTGT